MGQLRTPSRVIRRWQWQPSCRILYYSLIYCVSVWGLTYNSNLKRSVTFQKKAIRIVAKVPFDSHTDPIFRDLKLLKFSDLVLCHLGKFMFFSSKGLLPNSFNDMFTVAHHIRLFNTRNSSNCNFYIPLVTKYENFQSASKALNFFNSRDSQIKSSGSTAQFSKNLKRFLLYR